MRHNSVPLFDSPIELIDIKPMNPLISKCMIKVCYVGEEPNRNNSIITKEVAKQMAESLPGCPIVGYYSESTEDFEEHNEIIDISNGEIKIKDTTIPYGFVDLNAKIWFQKFLDDDKNEREYLCTEGYLWTEIYPESNRIIEKGNNQSMELDKKTLKGSWVKDGNNKPKFFIINEALISKLCILGEDFEPCFEGATITNFSLTFEQGFKDKLFAMISEVTEFLQKGGENVYTTYAVEIGNSLWNAIYDYLQKNYPANEQEVCHCSKYRIDGIYEEDDQKFVILQDCENNKYFRLDFSISEEDGFVPNESLIEVTKTYVPATEPQFPIEAVQAFELEYNKKFEENSDNLSQENISENNDTTEEENSITYALEEIPEYVQLQNDYANLQASFDSLQTSFNTLNTEVEVLRQFKYETDKKAKQAMIESFYMLNNEDKKDVIDNIDKYSLDDIEAKLSIICVRNKVNFNLDESAPSGITTYNLEDSAQNESVPAWIKAAMDVEKEMH